MSMSPMRICDIEHSATLRHSHLLCQHFLDLAHRNIAVQLHAESSLLVG